MQLLNFQLHSDVFVKRRISDLFIDDETDNTEVVSRTQIIAGQTEPNNETEENTNNITENVNETSNNVSEDNSNDTIKKINWDL
ncbi:MAG: hypothetical protein IKP28_06375 [Clostridia bacterium]|nr:hypothetical protein [Clostridia bacterium]